MKRVAPKLTLALLVCLAYTLGTAACLRAARRAEGAAADDGALKKMLGEGRRLFAGQFVEMADLYFHSGLHPSIFDRTDSKAPTAVVDAVESADDHDHDHHEHDEHGDEAAAHADEDEHVKAMTPGAAHDWLESFIRRFRITEHSHLANGETREILPWLRVAIELDPQAIDTYTTAAFWLRKDLQRPEEAKKVLREGIRNNPASHELLFEMGRVYKESDHDLNRARNIWKLVLRRWLEQSEPEREKDKKFCAQIASNLAELEFETGHLSQAVDYFKLAKLSSPKPEAIQKRIDELKTLMASPQPPPVASPSP